MPAKRNNLALRILYTLCMVILLSAILSSCGEVIVEPKWVIGVKGAEAAVFSSLDYAKLQEVSATTKTTQPDGSITEETWQGVLLQDVVDYLDVREYSSVTLTAADGTACEYSRALINESSVILAAKRGGRELEDEGFNYLYVIDSSHENSLRLSKLNSIIINE